MITQINFRKRKQKKFRQLRLFIALPLIILISTLALFSFTVNANLLKFLKNNDTANLKKSLTIMRNKFNRSEQLNYITTMSMQSSTNLYSEIVRHKILFLEFECKV